MTFDEWMVKACAHNESQPQQRKGQAYFNSLNEHRPDIANRLRSTIYDPFYGDDRRVLRFLTKVKELW